MIYYEGRGWLGVRLEDKDVGRCRDVRVIISVTVMCDGNVITEYDGRRSGLPSAPVVIEYDNNRDHSIEI